MKILASALYGLTRQGRLSLQIPEPVIKFRDPRQLVLPGFVEEPEDPLLDLPNEYFERVRADAAPLPVRTGGFLWLSPIGYKRLKAKLKLEFQRLGREDWETFEEPVESYFARRASAIRKREKALKAELAFLRARR